MGEFYKSKLNFTLLYSLFFLKKYLSNNTKGDRAMKDFYKNLMSYWCAHFNLQMYKPEECFLSFKQVKNNMQKNRFRFWQKNFG